MSFPVKKWFRCFHHGAALRLELFQTQCIRPHQSPPEADRSDDAEEHNRKNHSRHDRPEKMRHAQPDHGDGAIYLRGNHVHHVHSDSHVHEDVALECQRQQQEHQHQSHSGISGLLFSYLHRRETPRIFSRCSAGQSVTGSLNSNGFGTLRIGKCLGSMWKSNVVLSPLTIASAASMPARVAISRSVLLT